MCTRVSSCCGFTCNDIDSKASGKYRMIIIHFKKNISLLFSSTHILYEISAIRSHVYVYTESLFVLFFAVASFIFGFVSNLVACIPENTEDNEPYHIVHKYVRALEMMTKKDMPRSREYHSNCILIIIFIDFFTFRNREVDCCFCFVYLSGCQYISKTKKK